MRRPILSTPVLVAIGALLALSFASTPVHGSSACRPGATLLFQSATTGATLCGVTPSGPAPAVAPPAPPKPPANQHPPVTATSLPEQALRPPAALPENLPGGVESTATGLTPPPAGGLITATGERVPGPSTTIPAPPRSAAAPATATQSFCAGSTPIPYLTTNPFYSTEDVSVVVEPDPAYACSATYFYFYSSRDGGKTYSYDGGNSIDQMGFDLTNWTVQSTLDWAVVACDSACSNFGYLGSYCGSQDETNYSFNGQNAWFYQDWGTVNDGYGYTGAKGFASTQQPSGANEYIGWLQTPQPGTNLTNLGEQFTYIDAFTSNGTFYQIGYSVNATGTYFFSATTFSAGGFDKALGEWSGIGCMQGAARQDYPPGMKGNARNITVRCTIPLSGAGLPTNQELEYDVLVYANQVYVQLNGGSPNAALMSADEMSNGYAYTAQGTEEASGDANVNPTTAFGSSSPTRITGYMEYSYFALNGQTLSHVANDYTINSDLFDGTTGATSLPGLCGLVGSLQKDAYSYNGYNLHWDKQYQDC